MDRTTRLLRAAAVAGFVMLAVAIAMVLFYPPTLDTLPDGFYTPILAIEYLASFSDAQTIFVSDAALIAQVQKGHYVDMVFLLTYSAFLALPNGAFWHHKRHWSSLVGIAAALVAAIADCGENLQLLQLGDALTGDTAPPDFGLLRLYMGTKFLAITISMLCLSRNMILQGVLGRLFGAASFILVPVTMLGLDGNPLMLEAMGLLILVAWIILLVWLMRMRAGFPASMAASQS